MGGVTGCCWPPRRLMPLQGRGLEGSARRLRLAGGVDHGDHPVPVVGCRHRGCAGVLGLIAADRRVVVRRKVR
jgi:hypothetical protein